MTHKCDLCKGEYDEECIEVNFADINEEVRDDLFQDEDEEDFIDEQRKVYLCENCRAMDARCKLMSSISSAEHPEEVIEQVKQGLYIKQ